MALFKQIGTNYGIVASYWKITDISLNSLDGTAHVVVSGYPDREIRLAGYLPLKTLEYSVSAEDVYTYFPTSLDIAQVYGYLKTLGDFIFSEDA
jgi:hypothetical protein